MNTWRLIFLGGALCASSAFAQAESQPVAIKDMSKPIQRAVQLWMAGGSLESVDQVQEQGRLTYEVEYKNKEGRERDFTLAENGTLLSLEIALADAPAPVQKALIGKIGTGTLDSIEKNLDPDGTTFDISLLTKEGKDNDFTLDGDGKVISQTVELTETPDAVQHAIKAQTGSNTIEDIEKIFDEDGTTITYQVALTMKDGSVRSFTVDGSNGQLESLEISLPEAPLEVQKTIASEVGPNQLESIDKLFDPDAITYETTYYTKAGAESHFTVSPDGKLVSREVALTDTPAPVQQTIKQQLGNGKVLRIDLSLAEKDSGVLPFEVQGEKNGKPFDFSVGPKGRFLGMDD
jgi:uncharacterized membrane protein YkoI